MSEQSKYIGKTYKVNIQLLHPMHGFPPMKQDIIESWIEAERKEFEEEESSEK